jgi:hypothetical protein
MIATARYNMISPAGGRLTPSRAANGQDGKTASEQSEAAPRDVVVGLTSPCCGAN